MDVTSDLIEKIPSENLHVPREDFADLWHTAEALGQRPATGSGNHYLLAVISTCRWIAAQPLHDGRRYTVPLAPFSNIAHTATPETITAEYLDAVTCPAASHPNRLDLAAGTIATLDWCWNGTAHRPLNRESTITAG